MAENLITLTANLGISSITWLMFWFWSMFSGALPDLSVREVMQSARSLEKKHQVYVSRWYTMATVGL